MIYNYWTSDFLKIKEGEEVCPVCKGLGVKASCIVLNRTFKTICFKCSGHGVIDWIEKAVGKKTIAIGSIEF